jgi:hypothetical protein
MERYICVTCGTQFAASAAPPAHCPICEDERQYIGPNGQEWTTLAAMRENHRNTLRFEEPNLTGIGTEPAFAIGQRALLLQAPGGNILWDCISLVDDETVRAVNALGGISAIGVSHPHFFASMIEWSHAFGGAPIHLHASNRRWVQRPDAAIHYWDGETYPVGEGLTLVRCGGHFEGFTVLHWAAGAEGRGALLAGDQPQVVADRRYVTFMYSYPNYIPLPGSEVERIVRTLEPYRFDRIYGGWFDRVIPADAKGIIARSAARYLKAIGA